jgi:hypothetical protein
MNYDEIGAVEILVRRAEEIILITPAHKAALGQDIIQVIADALKHYREALAKEGK